MRKVSLRAGARIIRDGGIVAYPTETVYGLAADPKNEKAIGKLFEIKGRNKGRPILLVISSRREVVKWALGVGKREKKLMSLFWPGPLTLIFKAQKNVSPLLTGGSGKIGLRLSESLVARKLARLAGGAITSTSANLSGFPPALTEKNLEKQLGDSLDGLVRGSQTKNKKLSTILDVSSSNIKVLREGKVSVSKLI